MSFVDTRVVRQHKLPPGLAKSLALAALELDAGESKIVEIAVRAYIDGKRDHMSERVNAAIDRLAEADKLLKPEGE
jgi:hypothetical protein